MTSAAGKHYRLYSTTANWWNAQNGCNNKGGYLVTYYTQQEQLDVEVSRAEQRTAGWVGCGG
jgi:hypothetical protein